MNNQIIINNGLVFGIPARIYTLLLFIPSAFLMLLYGYAFFISGEETKMGIFLFLCGILVSGIIIFVLFTSEGIQVNIENKTFRPYLKTIGYTRGKWLSLGLFNYLSIIESRKSGRIGRVTTVGVSETSYNLIIMDKTHRNKKILKNFDTFSSAKLFADQLSKQTELPLVKYAPKRLSNSTRR